MSMSAGPYCDRVCSPEQTLERIAPHLASYGITRIARQTSLDTIGIPVYASFRPNALTLATNQGKGITEPAAKASAAMEALEFAVAERPECQIVVAAAVDLAARGLRTYRSIRTLPAGTSFPDNRELSWVRGQSLPTGEPWLVPLDMVRFAGSASELPGICQHTNGLASGNSPEEAIFHGLCELIERDAGTLWAIAAPERRADRRLDPAAFDDPNVLTLAAKIEAAGFSLTLFDQTSDLGVATVMAEIWPSRSRFAGFFEVSSGSGTHPVPARAALRAITEAAQSRVTAIAAARDDIDPANYRMETRALLLEANQRPTANVPKGLSLGTPLAELTSYVLDRFASCWIRNVLCIPLGGEKAGVSVVRILVEELEDWGVNLNWSPGRRALASLVGANR